MAVQWNLCKHLDYSFILTGIQITLVEDLYLARKKLNANSMDTF